MPRSDHNYYNIVPMGHVEKTNSKETKNPQEYKNPLVRKWSTNSKETKNYGFVRKWVLGEVAGYGSRTDASWALMQSTGPPMQSTGPPIRMQGWESV